MGKHKGEQANEEERGEDKADAFDAQWEESRARGQAKRDAGLYPYDLDPKFKKGEK